MSNHLVGIILWCMIGALVLLILWMIFVQIIGAYIKISNWRFERRTGIKLPP